MIVKEVIERVYREYEQDVDYPPFTDDDPQLWFGYLKDSFREWVKHFPAALREGYLRLADAVDGSKTTIANQDSYNVPSNFLRSASSPTINGEYYYFVPVQKLEYQKKNNATAKLVSLVGFEGAYKLLFYPTPASSGLPIEYNYFGYLDYPTNENSVIPITHPDFCVYYILYRLYVDDLAKKDLAEKYEQKMLDEVRLEKIDQIRKPFGQFVKTEDLSGFGFGVKSQGVLDG
jgi:hypothetical protein